MTAEAQRNALRAAGWIRSDHQYGLKVYERWQPPGTDPRVVNHPQGRTLKTAYKCMTESATARVPVLATPNISVYTSTTDREGSCNGCHIAAEGLKIRVVKFGIHAVRLCARCRKQLRDLL